MKNFTLRILFLFVLMGFSVSLFSLDKAKKGDKTITAKLDGYRVELGKGVATFVVTSESAGRCDLSFLALPAGDTLGNFSTYALMVNGVRLPEVISFVEPGWQQARTSGGGVLLNKGQNVVTFSSSGRDLPQVRQIERYTGERVFASTKELLTSRNSRMTSSIRNFSLQSGPPDPPYQREPLFRPGVTMDQPYEYTFFLPMWCDSGQVVSLYTPAPNDPRFGSYPNTVDHTIYFFHENPSIFSISETSIGKWLNFSATAPRSGLYYVLAEAVDLDLDVEWKVITLLINNALYSYSFVSDCNTPVLKQDPSRGVYVSAPDSCFNIFTVKPRNGNGFFEANPRLWLKRYDPQEERFVVVGHNDDNVVVSVFDWGMNARIRTKLNDDTEYSVLLSSHNPPGYAPDTCDLYHSFWNNPIDEENYSVSVFPNLKYEDAIESDDPKRSLVNEYNQYNPGYDYNCHAWAGGINVTWAAPCSWEKDKISWFDAFYNNNTVSGMYGTIMRVPNSLRYTRNGATEENAIVDLWGKIQNGEITPSHSSIRSYACDGIPHGYDWESKLGGTPRIFHPRYALSSDSTGGGYGNVIAHYRIADGQEGSYRSPQRVMAEAVADETWRVENIYLTDEEEALLSNEVGRVANPVKNEFNRLYADWKEYTDARKHLSDILKFRECEAYATLLNYTISTTGAAYLAYDEFIQGDFLAAILIRDLALAPSSTTQAVWNNIMNAPIVNNTMRTAQANVTLYIKSVLQATETPNVTGVVRSNDDAFSVTAAPSQITVEIEIEKEGEYTVEAIGLETNRSFSIAPARAAKRGKHVHTATLPSGMYVVTYTLNGNLNCKKIVVP